jgi:DNA-binding transcriptional ArsR family regulator
MSEESPEPSDGAGEQGAGQQGIGGPAAGQRSGSEQSAGEQGSGEQGAGQQGADGPVAGQPDAGGPGAGEPAAGQPDAGEQGAGQRGAGGHDWEMPWIEAIGAGRPERARLAAEFGEGFRKTNSLMQLMGQAAADRVGLNATDLNCLNILSFSGEMTAGELARQTGLTTASITGVADRLEEAGYVRRERDPKDRRRVVIRLVLETALRDVAPVFLPLVQSWQGVVDRYTDDELRLIVEFYGLMEEVIRAHLARLRGPAEPDPPAGPGPLAGPGTPPDQSDR